jgi:hypothetical protein
MSLLFGCPCASERRHRTGIFLAMLTGVVFSIAWLRTTAYGWPGNALRLDRKQGVLFGFRSPARGLPTLIQTTTIGHTPDRRRVWPEGSTFMVVALLLGLIVLIRTTRVRRHYTHEPIVPAGYPMDIPPPAAHTAMEHPSGGSSPLIQILPRHRRAVPPTQNRSSDASSLSTICKTPHLSQKSREQARPPLVKREEKAQAWCI